MKLTQLLLLFASASLTNAAVLSSYDFTGGSLLSSDTDAYTSSSSFDVTEYHGDAGSGYYQLYGSSTDNINTDALYGSFQINADSYGMSGFNQTELTTMTFDYYTTFATGSSSLYMSYRLYNADGSIISTTGLGVVVASATNPISSDEITVDLSSITLSEGQGVRFYFDGNDDQPGSGQHRFDNIVVNGNSVVPEPSSLAMLGLGGLAIVSRRRR